MERVKKHEKYNKERHANDIVLIRIEGKFEFNDQINAIDLSSTEVPENAEVQFSGWGVKSVR